MSQRVDAIGSGNKAAANASFDHLVGAGKYGLRNNESERTTKLTLSAKAIFVARHGGNRLLPAR
jgi:hypothetical protein